MSVTSFIIVCFCGTDKFLNICQKNLRLQVFRYNYQLMKVFPFALMNIFSQQYAFGELKDPFSQQRYFFRRKFFKIKKSAFDVPNWGKSGFPDLCISLRIFRKPCYFNLERGANLDHYRFVNLRNHKHSIKLQFLASENFWRKCS